MTALDLLALNDDLARLASSHGVTPDTFASQNAYEDWLDDLTHVVAEKLDEEY